MWATRLRVARWWLGQASPIARVDRALQIREGPGGAVHPLRAVPLDLVAEAVFREAGSAVCPDRAFDAALDRVCRRYAPPRISHSDVVSV